MALVAQVVYGQDKAPDSDGYPTFEFFGGYSAIAPTNSRIQYDFGAVDVEDGFRTPDGYELSVIGNLKEHVGITADFAEYFRSFDVFDSGQQAQFDSRTYDFLFGPEIKTRNRYTRFTPFARALVGLQHVDATCRQGPPMTFGETVSNNAVALGLGGGLDFRISDRISLRGQVEYAPAFYPNNPISGDVRQDLIRFSVGVLFH